MLIALLTSSSALLVFHYHVDTHKHYQQMGAREQFLLYNKAF